MKKAIVLLLMFCTIAIWLYGNLEEKAGIAPSFLPACEGISYHNSNELPFGAKMGKFIKENSVEAKNYRIKKIVIDPGHGGRDNGCSGKNSKEKVIALNIAKKLGAAIEYKFPDVQVIYTRKKDVFIPLHKRAKIANEHQADLFLSIHCNYISKAAHIRGSETYVMGLHTAEENLEVAKRENEAILMEENYEQNYAGFDPFSSEGHIFLSMYQNAYLEQSIRFAEQIEQRIKSYAGRKSRGVKQAGFVVLRQTAMPSVLVETGYLSNSSDNTYLLTSKGQQKIANAIFRAFKAYKNEIETPMTGASIVQTSIATSESYNANPAPETEKDQIVFRVQLASSKVKVDISQSKWQKMPYPYSIHHENKAYKYQAGDFNQFSEALHAQRKLKKEGFPDAFVLAYKNGKRMSLKTARELTSKS